MARPSSTTPASGPGGRPVTGDWRVFRPAIWLVMLGIGLLLVVNGYLGIAVIGAGIGTGARIETRRRRLRRSGGGTVRTRRR
ncbi:MAG TPA: hypothetical protein VG371_11615 [Solirubrobacteraceae bacterium]|nr:hypothetical protein [Solirubrobacteraceae bacterium]